MAALNLTAYPPSISSTIDADFGIAQDYTDSGILLRRGLFDSPHYILNLRWDLLDIAARDYLEVFFETNRLSQISFNLDGFHYYCELISGPDRRWVSGTLYGLSVMMRGDKGPLLL